MNNKLEPLILDLVEWVAKAPRTYAETIEAWRTSCPRLTVWEDTIDLGYLTIAVRPDTGEIGVAVAAPGMLFLTRHGRAPTRPARMPADSTA